MSLLLKLYNEAMGYMIVFLPEIITKCLDRLHLLHLARINTISLLTFA